METVKTINMIKWKNDKISLNVEVIKNPNRKNKAMEGKIYYQVRRHKIIWITNMKRHTEILSLTLNFFNYTRNKKNIL